jgi:predicted metalloprotease with PDZ domain
MDLRPFRVLTIASVSLLAAGTLAAVDSRSVTLEVDAREAPKKMLHAKLAIPVAAGPLTLLYPEWLPGEHGPTGPIADLAGLSFSAGGKAIPWRRDDVNMYAFHLDVPVGAGSVEVTLDYLSPAGEGGFSSGSSATANLALISWNQVLLYPKGARADELLYTAALRLPAGWKYATALQTERANGERVEFSPVSLTTLVDSPVLTGLHFRVVTLTAEPPAHRIDIAADSEAALEMSPELEERFRALVAETDALFGARHYRHYDFLLTLSDHTAHFGLEHHESSDDRTDERALVDPNKRKTRLVGLLTHEMSHSWNGKYRRPADLAIGKLDEPMHGDLLWVYEGLTEYLGQILTGRSGLLTPEEYREDLALTAAQMDHQKGRTWRPLSDTAVAAQILYGARPDWASWRRGTDFYPESELLWLEADTVIRTQTKGARSLDDFCRAFHGRESGPPKVVPYTFEDVAAALGQIAPYDWKRFWTARLNSTAPRAPLNGILESGWKLVYNETVSAMQKAAEEASESEDESFSIGFAVRENGTIPDVIPDSPAAKAGVGPGTKLVAVNGRRWKHESSILRDAVKASRTQPIELLVENGEFLQSCRLDYNGGARYPHLQRDPAKPDLLSEIVRPHAAIPGKAR